MSDQNIRRASLAEIRKMKAAGELGAKTTAPEGPPPGEELGPEFWAKAQLEEPKSVRPVLLKLEPEVFEFFKKQGKGHVSKMQAVLKAYVKAHQPS